VEALPLHFNQIPLEYRDLIVTPLLIMVVYMVAIFVRPYATDEVTRKYFFPALTLKMIGAIALGIIYQFYYRGGDTYNYHTIGSRIVWQAFADDFSTGLRLLFSNGDLIPGAYKYYSRIYFYGDPPSFMIIRFATVFDLLTYSTYSATAVFFSVISFSGSWALFVTFYKKFPHLHFRIAIATLFIPSVIFWGSGLLKDTFVLAALGFAVYSIDKIFNQHRFKTSTVGLLLLSLFVIFSIRKFVLEAFIPSAVLWVYFKHLVSLRSTVLKITIVPLIVVAFILTAYYSVIKIGEGDEKYSVEKLAATAQVTAYDIAFYTGKNAGSTYSLGKLDGSFSSLFRLAPQAINVTLFRPYLWEVKNPLMFFTALEGLFFLLATFYVLVRGRLFLLKIFSDSNVLFCFVFSISFAFAVGVSTFNFGTLVRYKIPAMPFYMIGLIIAVDQLKRDRKLSVFDETE